VVFYSVSSLSSEMLLMSRMQHAGKLLRNRPSLFYRCRIPFTPTVVCLIPSPSVSTTDCHRNAADRSVLYKSLLINAHITTVPRVFYVSNLTGTNSYLRCERRTPYISIFKPINTVFRSVSNHPPLFKGWLHRRSEAINLQIFSVFYCSAFTFASALEVLLHDWI